MANKSGTTTSVATLNELLTFSNIIHDENKDGLILLDADGTIQMVDVTAERLFLYQCNELLGFPISVLVPEIAESVVKSNLDAHLTHLKNAALRHGYGVSCLRKDGSPFFGDMGFMEIDINGTSHIVCIISDISRRRVAEEGLARKQIGQEVVNDLLKLFMQDRDLDHLLDDALEQVLAVPWLNTEGGGCVFLLDQNTNTLVMKAYDKMPQSVVAQCGRIPVGESMCGHIASKQEVRLLMVNEKCSCKYPSVDAGAVSTDCPVCPQEEHVDQQNSMYYCGLPVYHKDELLGFVLLYLSVNYRYSEGDAEFFESVSGALACGIKLKQSEEYMLKLLTNNRLLTKRLIRAQEAERTNLARELHDELGQSLTAIRAEATIIANHTQDKNQYINESAHSIIDVSNQLYDVTHAIMTRLRPSALDELGLVDTMRNYIKDWRRTHPWIKCELVLSGDLNNLGDDINITVYRIVQESLSNVIRHAAATKVAISVSRNRNENQKKSNGDDCLEMMIEDNGRGLRTDYVQPTDGHGQMGLIGIQERIEDLDGRLQIVSERGQGLRLEGWIPLDFKGKTAGFL